VSVDIRTITIDEADAFRRAVRAGFGSPETIDDGEWARAVCDPVDRVLAAFDRGGIVATFQSFATEVTVPGGALVASGAVTAVTCRATHRRQGLLTRMMLADLAASRDRGEIVDVLIAAEYPIYGRFGYGPAVLSTGWELDTAAAEFVMPGAGTVEFIDNETLRKEGPAIFDRVRRSRPGMIDRSEFDWDVRADLRRRPEDKPWLGFRVLCRDGDGVAQGWANYLHKEKWADMRPQSTAEVSDLCAATTAAEIRLWRFLTELDHVATVTAGDRPADELLPWVLNDARAAKQTARSDFVWVRPLDVAALLTARSYTSRGRVVIEVDDPQGIAGGRFVLDASPDGTTCRTTSESAEVTMPVRTLGAVSLGGIRLASLHAAGWSDEHVPGAVERTDALLAGAVAPWCNTWF